MDKFAIHCTEEQTKKALELGAPITTSNDRFDEHVSPICKEGEQWLYAIIPTAEEMIGWLEEQGILVGINHCDYEIEVGTFFIHCRKKGRVEATLAAIDAALEYLSKK